MVSLRSLYLINVVFPKSNTGTFLHIAHEEGLITNRSIHAGIRAPVSRPKKDRRNDIRCGFATIRARDIDKIGVQGIIQKLRDRVKGTKVYVSVDIDVLDPAYAPGMSLTHSTCISQLFSSDRL
jgi:agmatinase